MSFDLTEQAVDRKVVGLYSIPTAVDPTTAAMLLKRSEHTGKEELSGDVETLDSMLGFLSLSQTVAAVLLGMCKQQLCWRVPHSGI